jgi:6-pyruvoyltetrahydropterin/6-carboxytetrahydropterin synthase
MKTVCRKSYTFSAAHWIPSVPDGHKCRNMHGHTFRVTIEAGEYNEDSGMCIEFGILDGIVGEVLGKLDHTTLNNNKALDVPTVEVLSRYIFGQLQGKLRVIAVTVREGDGGEATTNEAPR